MGTFKVFYGAAKPLTAVGKHQVAMLEFAAEYPGWHSYYPNPQTLRALAGLERRGSVFVNRENTQFVIAYSQFRTEAGQ
jgi:hypothetical protein